MNCPNCGYDVPETKYCLCCGKPLLLKIARKYDRRRNK